MTPDLSKARKLIEEARKRACNRLNEAQACMLADKLDEALSLLPEWQEFDPKREETWPKEETWQLVTIKDGDRVYSITRYWAPRYIESDWKNVLAYQPLPPPYEKK